MKPKSATHNPSAFHQRVGRKVLLADRLSHALSDSKHKKTAYLWRFLPRKPKTIVLFGIIAIAFSGLGIGGAQFYLAQAEATKKAAAAEKQSKQAAKSIAAEACRRQKAEQKAELIGKVTYDELYDYDECDK